MEKRKYIISVPLRVELEVDGLRTEQEEAALIDKLREAIHRDSAGREYTVRTIKQGRTQCYLPEEADE